jgi:hypothetical protein
MARIWREVTKKNDFMAYLSPCKPEFGERIGGIGEERTKTI